MDVYQQLCLTFAFPEVPHLDIESAGRAEFQLRKREHMTNIVNKFFVHFSANSIKLELWQGRWHIRFLFYA